jgi:SAM-dependent MidA family methyltransferase
VFEVSSASTAIMAVIADRLTTAGGAALAIDYGYRGAALSDTLQAVRRHAYDDPLSAPGEADLTAHVDFGALAAAAEAAGARPRPLLDQGEFLMRLGLAERAERLARGKDDATRAAIATAARRLAAPDAMGRLFKVLAVSAPGLALPAFDADA